MRFICATFTVLSTLCFAAVAQAESIQGSYVEARSTPDQEGQPSQAVLAWQIREGNYDGEKLDGQTIIAVVIAEPSPGSTFAHTKTAFFVDSRTSAAAEKALVHLAKDLAPAAIHDTGTVTTAKIDVRIAEGCGCGAAVVECPLAKVRTRKLTDADQPLLGDCKSETPLGDVFSSNQTFADQFSFAERPITVAGHITAFAGSFSR